MRKLFVAIFATMLPFAAAWADNVAKIGETEYETLAEAVSAAKSGEIIHVVAQGTYTIPTISNNITIKGDVEGIAFNCIGDEKKQVSLPFPTVLPLRAFPLTSETSIIMASSTQERSR